MAGWRDIRAVALGIVHSTFQTPAVYLSHSGAAPFPIPVRIHRKNEASPILRADDWTNSAAHLIQTDRLIFDLGTLPTSKPKSGGFVIVSAVEIYRIGQSEPVKNGYIAADVVPVEGQELANLLAAQDAMLPVWEGIL